MTDRPEKPSDEPVKDIRFWVQAFGDEVERSAEAAARRGKGGQQVGYHSADFAYVPPSVFGRLRWWLRAFNEALESELTARTAETEEQAAELAQAEAVFAELALPVLNERPRSDAASAWRDKVQAALNAIRAALAKARGGEGG